MSKLSWPSKNIFPIAIWIIAIAIRIYGSIRPAQYYDMITFEAWSRSFWAHGPQAFFSTVWSDYLPLPILTFAPVSLIADFFHAPFGLTFKLIHLVLELILISLIPGVSFAVKALLLLSPALIGDNSFWGQVDTIPALLGLLSLTTLLGSGQKGQIVPKILGTSILLGLAVAYKPIMILIAPILWIVSIKRGISWWKLPLLSSVVFFLTAIPTGGINFVSHIFSRIFAQTGTYPFLTVNAFNLWSLVPNLSWISDSTSVFNISGHNFGFTIFVILSAVTINHWRKTSFSLEFAPRVAATILILFYTFTTRMHERHLLFGLPFLTLAVSSQPWLLIPLSLLTVSFTLNLYGAYFWVYNAQTWPFSTSVISIISWVIVLSSLGLSTIWNLDLVIQTIKKIFAKNKILIGIMVLATVLRFTNLSYPSTYIFDEVYHAFTSREYLNNHVVAWEWWTTPPEGVAYEWTHPPVAKYGMVVGMLLFGENSFGWRIGSSTFGIISILGLYLFVLALTRNKNVALISAFLVSIEGLHIAQSRIAMNDMYMLTFFIWSLYMAIKSRWKSAAVLYGLSLASKWSALYGVIPLALIYLSNFKINSYTFKSTLLHLFFAIRLLLISLSVYVLTFAPFILAGHTWEQWWELHRQMWYYHTHLVATHGYQSTPLQWLFGARPVWYYVQYLGSSISNIYAQSNPLILWLGLLAIVMQLKKIIKFPYFLLYTLYFVLFIPWIISPRIMFFYHYLPSSVFLCVILATWLSTLSRSSALVILVFCTLSLVLIAPMLYGLPMSQVYWNMLFGILPSWK